MKFCRVVGRVTGGGMEKRKVFVVLFCVVCVTVARQRLRRSKKSVVFSEKFCVPRTVIDLL
jgi:hypothetical protein